MTILRAIVDRLVLVTLILGAGTAPSYIHQYRQQVGGRLDQVRTDLAGFRTIAERRHGGDMDALIAHHLTSFDETFQREGVLIRGMMEHARALETAYAALDAPLVRQAWFMLHGSDPQIARATWALFEPSFALTLPSIVFALIVGSCAWLILFLAWRALGVIGRAMRPSRSAAR